MSLRLRLLLAVGAVALVALVAADVVTYRSLRTYLYDRVDQTLESSHQPLEALADGRGGPGGPDVRRSPGLFIEIRGANGDVEAQAPAVLPGGEQVAPKLPAHITGLHEGPEANEPIRYLTVASADEGPKFRVRVGALQDGGQLIIALPLNNEAATLHRLFNIELAVTAGALVAAALLGWWLVRLGLRPLKDVEDTAIAIADGELDRRVPGDEARTEVGRVARALNTMLTRIEEAFTQRDATEAKLRRFVSDASHELRTPLAAVSAYAELFDRGASDRPEDRERVIAGIRSESARMGRLVEDLLLLARLDEGRPLERKPVELVGLAGEAVHAATAVGPAWPVELVAKRPVEVVGDDVRLRQVLDNLLANVRAHTPPGTTASVTVGEDDDHAVVEVADDGPGLTDDEAARVFERFYRADPSRSRAHGGTGLGLGIVAAIVGAHGGDVRASSPPGAGARFTVRLPLNGSAPVSRL